MESLSSASVASQRFEAMSQRPFADLGMVRWIQMARCDPRPRSRACTYPYIRRRYVRYIALQAAHRSPPKHPKKMSDGNEEFDAPYEHALLSDLHIPLFPSLYPGAAWAHFQGRNR